MKRMVLKVLLLVMSVVSASNGPQQITNKDYHKLLRLRYQAHYIANLVEQRSRIQPRHSSNTPKYVPDSDYNRKLFSSFDIRHTKTKRLGEFGSSHFPVQKTPMKPKLNRPDPVSSLYLGKIDMNNKGTGDSPLEFEDIMFEIPAAFSQDTYALQKFMPGASSKHRGGNLRTSAELEQKAVQFLAEAKSNANFLHGFDKSGIIKKRKETLPGFSSLCLAIESDSSQSLSDENIGTLHDEMDWIIGPERQESMLPSFKKMFPNA